MFIFNDEGQPTAAWKARLDRQVAEAIRAHGCFLQAVGADRDRPPFCYTVGLFGIGHPELIVFGLDQFSSGHVLNWFFDRIRNGEGLTPGEIVQAPNGGPRFLVEAFPKPGAALFTANRHYRRSRMTSVPAYQLTWDVDGCFPWDEGYPYPPTLQPRPGEYVE